MQMKDHLHVTRWSVPSASFCQDADNTALLSNRFRRSIRLAHQCSTHQCEFPHTPYWWRRDFSGRPVWWTWDQPLVQA